MNAETEMKHDKEVGGNGNTNKHENSISSNPFRRKSVSFFRSILNIKLKDINRRKYLVTPDPTTDDYTAIMEARGYGVSQKIFYDTSDKIVLFPHHIPGHDHAYNPRGFGYSSHSGWTNDKWKGSMDDIYWRQWRAKDDKKIKQIYYIFCELRDRLRNVNPALRVDVIGVSGSEKGYLSIYLNEDDSFEDDTPEDIALWIWLKENDSLTKI
ncbi:MAG: hypothetical protein Sylvanvirus16_12 [Sylvanvirus sp.]|uniref:Uncharacterized protein n=1 Tax=Sylvanvirus sp. TaxID=2487774 RepID=A0A3G5AJZ8_9VIRU|nr:MAG: hypothetical protein Sylvanvirus16_12 [Sylvanvirus sp.]